MQDLMKWRGVNPFWSTLGTVHLGKGPQMGDTPGKNVKWERGTLG